MNYSVDFSTILWFETDPTMQEIAEALIEDITERAARNVLDGVVEVTPIEEYGA